MLQVLGADRFRHRQAQNSAGSFSRPEKRTKVESSSEVRRGCLADWMELSVHVNPSLKQNRHRPLPRGLQDRYASSVRQYLTETILRKGKERCRAAPGKHLVLEVLQVHEGPEGVLLQAQVVQACLSCKELPQGFSVRLLLHQKHPALQAAPLLPGTRLQVGTFSMVQDTGTGCGSLLLPTEIHVL
eukprot:Skav223627  [mRNA]  locus=scaffold46:113328:118191:+ [translate_table: standard]